MLTLDSIKILITYNNAFFFLENEVSGLNYMWSFGVCAM